ncbi:hypothetical protein GI374_12140 [Paracoccus sp. S-4012]|uniref:hypothetical protein n=1 Tax=Paracoccus sp. S-4012 TaxID=2665648 RepID=UPI0012AF15A2|nr:hypothetical protein [Paracoccus sp. S-4012]MRX51185.1 hypothetical protein [Paracoccus sp. S-4012]
MGELADRFGGKVNGELIRAADWNGLIDGIEAQLAALGGRVTEEVGGLATRLAAAEATAADLAARLDPLEALNTVLTERQRRLDLSSTRAAFAVGERAEIVARVTDLHGQPLDLTDAGARPWVDFVCVWGSLKPAPGFTSRAGTGGRSVTVQVNDAGEARVLLREEAGETFAEEQELEIDAVLQTTVAGVSVAQSFLNASTPGASEIAPAFSAVTAAYERADTGVMRNYLDAVYLERPSRAFSPITPAFVLNWRDEFATVMAFVKPDDSPGTGDAAMAAGSIRVTFRDWVYPWLVTHYLPVSPPILDRYRAEFTPLILRGFEPAVSGIFETIQSRTRDRGILGTQREMIAAREAMRTLPLTTRPAYLDSVVGAVNGGLTVQQGLLFSQAMAPLMEENTAPARAIGIGAARGEAAAGAVAEAIRGETEATVNAAEGRLLDTVKAENLRLSSELLSDDGPVRRAENIALKAAGEVDTINAQLGQKAGLDLVGQLLNVRGGNG